jgi:hypothetical protein
MKLEVSKVREYIEVGKGTEEDRKVREIHDICGFS